MNKPQKSHLGHLVVTLSLIFLNGCALFGTPFEQKLLGQWQGQLYGRKISLIFASESKIFIFDEGSPVAQEAKYRIDAKTKPMQLDLSGKEPILQTIFDLNDANKLRVEDFNFKSPRPTAFSANSLIFDKVSDTTTLPANMRVENLETLVNTNYNKGLQAQAKQTIGSMNRAQQAYYLENSKFGTTIESLGVGIKPETEQYRYQIIPQGDGTKSVIMTATAKNPELKSYTGAVFVVKSTTGENLQLTQICVTDQPSSTPAMPLAPSDASQKIQCSAGSTPLTK